MLEQLIPSRRTLSGEDPIFKNNAEATRRKAAGEAVINATVGALMDDAGQLVVLDTVMDLWKRLEPMQVAPYAPIAGDPAFLTALVQRHWPDRASYGVGCATPGGSGALMVSLHTFLEPGMSLLTAAPYWGPYHTLAAENLVQVATAPFPPAGQALDAEAWFEAGRTLLQAQGRLLIWLNDPCHNPTGHSLTAADRTALMEVLRRLADLGPVTLLLDCAYLDYTRDPQHVRVALDHYADFAREGRVLVGASLSVSKSLTLYGARCGALVFPWSEAPELQTSLTYTCRGMYSTSPKAPQAVELLLKADGKAQASLSAEHRHWSDILVARAAALDEALLAEGLPGCAWMGGFFITLRTSEAARVQEAMKTHGVFTVPMQWGVRVGICGLKTSEAPRLAAAFKAALG